MDVNWLFWFCFMIFGVYLFLRNGQNAHGCRRLFMFVLNLLACLADMDFVLECSVFRWLDAFEARRNQVAINGLHILKL